MAAPTCSSAALGTRDNSPVRLHRIQQLVHEKAMFAPRKLPCV